MAALIQSGRSNTAPAKARAADRQARSSRSEACRRAAGARACRAPPAAGRAAWRSGLRRPRWAGRCPEAAQDVAAHMIAVAA